MNATKKVTPAKAPVTSKKESSLGLCQESLESASKELRLAQENLIRATERFEKAEMMHLQAKQMLLKAFDSVKVENAVKPIGA